MRLVVISIIVAVFAGCDSGGDSDLRVFISPIDGTETIFEKKDVPGWDVYQLVDAPDKSITIAKPGQPVVYISDYPWGRTVSTGQKGDVSLLDSNYDGDIDRIDFYSYEPTVMHRATLKDGVWIIETAPPDNGN